MYDNRCTTSTIVTFTNDAIVKPYRFYLNWPIFLYSQKNPTLKSFLPLRTGTVLLAKNQTQHFFLLPSETIEFCTKDRKLCSGELSYGSWTRTKLFGLN